MKSLAPLLLALPLSALAGKNCFNNHIKEDMCRQASDIARETQRSLPITLSERVEMYSIEAKENKLIARVKLGVTEDEILATAKQKHIQPGVVKTRMAELAKNGVCANKNPFRSFVRLGGEMEYIYTHPSGNVYSTVKITSCD
ncbi:hypothetical protein [Symbiopectobacterium purcellii]|uniref:hypothetical protein n=1 Tax=Symbiopectobacterium purcellii TaxID=2871826 RepID=UPI003F8275F4